jgi:UPF0716 protein FxsA
MLRRLLLLFFVVPLVELLVIFLLAHLIGWGWTLALTVASSVGGAILARRSWSAWWQLVQREWAEGGFPVHRLGEGAILVTAMAFMITPGPLTGLVGILFTFAPVRERVSKMLVRWIGHRVADRFWRF